MGADKSRAKHWPRRLLIGVAVFVVLFSVVSFVIVKQVYDGNFSRADVPEHSAYLRYSDVAGGYPRREVSFASGENMLQGYVYGEPSEKALVVISHGLGGGADSYMAEIVCFVDAGYRVLAFDNTGSHASEGESTRGLPQSVIDLDAALKYVESSGELNTLPVLLYGHSWGGYAVTAVLNNGDPAIAGSVSVAGYNSPMGLLYEQAQSMMGFFAAVEYPYLWGYQRFKFGSTASLTAVDGINKSGIPVMLIHGSEDEMIAIDGAGTMAHRDEITNPNAEFVVRDKEGMNGHNTLFVSAESAEYMEVQDARWEEIKQQYGEDIPDDVLEGFYGSIDKELASQLDPAYVDMVLDFYGRCL